MKILLIEDHDLFREGLKLLLAKLDPTLEIIEAKDLSSGILQRNNHPGITLALFDLGLPGYTGTEALAIFKQGCSALPVVVLSGNFDRETVIQALESGAMGFIPKTASSDTLWSALQVVLACGVYIPPSVFTNASVGLTVRKTPAASLKDLSELALTERQLQVFRLIIQGKPNKQIAADPGLTESTIKAHVKPILKALNVTSRIQAI